MKILKVSLKFVKLSDALLVTFCYSILAMLTGNAYFPTTNPTLAAVSLLLDDFVAALSKAADGGKTLTILKNNKRTSLLNAMRLLASSVEDTANNDPAMLISSGFKINTGARNNWPLPFVPLILSIADGSYFGSFILKIAKADYAIMYELRFTYDEFGPDARWISVPPQTATTFEVRDLESGKKIWIQVRSINTKGVSEWCDPANFMIR